MNMMIALLLVVVLITVIGIYIKTRVQLISVTSTIDNRSYRVRNLPDKQNAADLLARIRMNIMEFSHALYRKRNQAEYKNYVKYIDQLYNRIAWIELSENGDLASTSYSVNKGEKIVMCMRSPNNKFHDINLLMYVVLHEISHVACPSYGHGDEFKTVFAFITQEAIKMGFYQKIDFNAISHPYCGISITGSIV